MVFKIALTGGVCSGKSTCLNVLKNEFIGLDYKVFIVNEQATQVINNGFTHELLNQYDTDEYKGLTWQTLTSKSQKMLEDLYTDMSKSLNEDVVILCDRGIIDGKSFETNKVWDKVLENINETDESILNRYDSVIFLDTVALDKPEYYTLSNNAARRETIEEAVLNNEKLFNVYKNHSHIHRVDNSTDFEGKISRVINYIKQDIKQKRKEIQTINEVSNDFDIDLD